MCIKPVRGKERGLYSLSLECSAQRSAGLESAVRGIATSWTHVRKWKIIGFLKALPCPLPVAVPLRGQPPPDLLPCGLVWPFSRAVKGVVRCFRFCVRLPWPSAHPRCARLSAPPPYTGPRWARREGVQVVSGLELSQGERCERSAPAGPLVNTPVRACGT